jgi:hypothetical protein
MSKLIRFIKNNNWFFIALLFFVGVIPFSEALVSVGSGVLLFTALAEDNLSNKLRRLRKNRVLLFLPAIYLIYFFSAVFFNNWAASLYDLRKSLFFLIIPLAFIFGKDISGTQKRFLFQFFSIAVIIATVVALIRYNIFNSAAATDIRNISLISHIRFSFQLVLAFWFFIMIIYTNYNKLNNFYLGFLIITAIYLFAFILFQHSLTGIFILITSMLFFIFFTISQARGKTKKILMAFAIFLISLPVAYVSWVIIKFYDFEKIDYKSIEHKTGQGNIYNHDFDNPMVENGRYVYLYVCEKELREEWNKISEYKYDSTGKNGFPVHSTLVRYLTSIGLRKDAQGVRNLNETDIRNIENGIANVIYQNKKFSLYPRIYQTVWEFYVYSKTGYANDHSLSQRIEYARAACSIIKHNFWFGVGTASWKEEFEKAYIANNSRLNKEHYASSHNQYLNYMVKFGITGFLIIMFLLIFPIILKKRYHDLLFLLFLVFMFFANFADSNFESHMGSSFFIFFYCIFLITDGINYLKLDESKNRLNLRRNRRILIS